MIRTFINHLFLVGLSSPLRVHVVAFLVLLNANSLLKPRAHKLRALSSSWAYMNLIPLEEILQAAVWPNSFLFAVHYLRDFGNQTDNLTVLRPVITAQKRMRGWVGVAIRH